MKKFVYVIMFLGSFSVSLSLFGQKRKVKDQVVLESYKKARGQFVQNQILLVDQDQQKNSCFSRLRNLFQNFSSKNQSALLPEIKPVLPKQLELLQKEASFGGRLEKKDIVEYEKTIDGMELFLLSPGGKDMLKFELERLQDFIYSMIKEKEGSSPARQIPLNLSLGVITDLQANSKTAPNICLFLQIIIKELVNKLYERFGREMKLPFIVIYANEKHAYYFKFASCCNIKSENGIEIGMGVFKSFLLVDFLDGHEVREKFRAFVSTIAHELGHMYLGHINEEKLVESPDDVIKKNKEKIACLPSKSEDIVFDKDNLREYAHMMREFAADEMAVRICDFLTPEIHFLSLNLYDFSRRKHEENLKVKSKNFIRPTIDERVKHLTYYKAKIKGE